MSKTKRSLNQRRQQLIAQAQTQRLAVAQALQPWHKPLGIVDRVLVGIAQIRRHPVLSMATYYGLRQLKLGQYWHWAWLAITGENKPH